MGYKYKVLTMRDIFQRVVQDKSVVISIHDLPSRIDDPAEITAILKRPNESIHEMITMKIVENENGDILVMFQSDDLWLKKKNCQRVNMAIFGAEKNE